MGSGGAVGTGGGGEKSGEFDGEAVGVRRDFSGKRLKEKDTKSKEKH